MKLSEINFFYNITFLYNILIITILLFICSIQIKLEKKKKLNNQLIPKNQLINSIIEGMRDVPPDLDCKKYPYLCQDVDIDKEFKLLKMNYPSSKIIKPDDLDYNYWGTGYYGYVQDGENYNNVSCGCTIL